MRSGVASEGRQARSARFTLMPTTAQAAGAAAVLWFAYLVFERSSPDHGAAGVVDVLIFPALGLIYVPLCALVAMRAPRRFRAAWWAMTAGLASWALGEIIFAYYELTRGQAPFPSWADAAYLFYVPCVAVALVLFPGGYGWRDKGRMVLDGLIVTGSFLLISWLSVMRGIWHGEGVSGLGFAVSLAYPVGDVLVMTLAVLVLLRTPTTLRVAFGLLVAGLVCAAVADSLWVHISNVEAHAIGPLPHLLYVANPLFIIVALVAAYRAQPEEAADATAKGRLPLWLPVVPLMGAAVAVGLSQKDAVTEAPVVITGAVLVAATLLRQFVEASELVRREQEIRDLAGRLTRDLDSAARYVASILPGPLDGPVGVTARYVPASAVGGDSFGYTWIDADHLNVYLIDVSGHGVESALMSVSVHNLVRSGGLPTETLLAPDQVLAELNTRFSMDDHGGYYFTMWYGVYQPSTGVLSYANAGHPPPLVGIPEGGISPLPGVDVPVGMFPDGQFTAESYRVPAGARILLYSDGVLGEPPQMAAFVALCGDLASADLAFGELGSATSEWLDDLIESVPASDDDRSLVLLTFPANEAGSE